MININEVKPLHFFSEISHYVYVEPISDKKSKYLHIASGQHVELGNDYVAEFAKAADQFTEVVKVGKEDKFWTQKQIDEKFNSHPITSDGGIAVATPKVKNIPRVGDVRVKGLRTIWEEIYTPHALAVGYYKQDESKTAKAYKAEKEAQIENIIAAVEKIATNKKGVLKSAREQLKHMQDNPILDYIPGELRTLIGYKVQFTSRDGKYDCYDVHATTANKIRPVNINTLVFIVFDGIKYELE